MFAASAIPVDLVHNATGVYWGDGTPFTFDLKQSLQNVPTSLFLLQAGVASANGISTSAIIEISDSATKYSYICQAYFYNQN